MAAWEGGIPIRHETHESRFLGDRDLIGCNIEREESFP